MAGERFVYRFLGARWAAGRERRRYAVYLAVGEARGDGRVARGRELGVVEQDGFAWLAWAREDAPGHWTRTRGQGAAWLAAQVDAEHQDDAMYTCAGCGAAMLAWQQGQHECPATVGRSKGRA